MKMDKFLPKPSCLSSSSYTQSPLIRDHTNAILVQQSSSNTLKATSSHNYSMSPTTKKSNLSTLEENEMNVRSIGQSLTERLHLISNDKMNKFNSSCGISQLL